MSDIIGTARGSPDVERRDVWMLRIRGAVAIVFGVLAVVWPGVTVIALAMLFGIFAIVTGVEQFVHAFSRLADTGQRTARIIAGALGVVVGLLALFWPGITGVVLAVMIGVWAILAGIADLWAATRERGGWWLALIGAVSIVAGLFVLFQPTVGALAVAWAIGLYAIIAGVLLLVGSWQLTHHAPGSGRGRPAAAGV